MFWILLVAALAAHASCQGLKYTGTTVLTQDEFCQYNNIRQNRCEYLFTNFLLAHPQFEKCTKNSPIYSDQCATIRKIEQQRQQQQHPEGCTGNKCNDFAIRFAESASPSNLQPVFLSANEPVEEPRPSVPYDLKVADFSLKLFQKAFPADNSANYIISPMMVQTLLSYLTDGASADTRQDMDAVLQLNTHDLSQISRALRPSYDAGVKSPNKLDTAAQIFKSTQIELLPDFRDTLKRKSVPLQDMDFSNRRRAADTINEWVRLQTRERIQNIVDENSIDPKTQLLLMNAIYFNGTWMYKFNKTQRGVFYQNERQQLPVKMMSLKEELRNGNTKSANNDDGLLWIELPYSGDQMSMLVFLPNERYQLDRELRKFNVLQFQQILSELEGEEMSPVKVHLPEFKAESTVSLVEPLKQMGLSRMFDGTKPFDRLTNDTVKISDVRQKSFLTVNQHGTVATSVTLVGVIPLSISYTMDFLANQPFAVMIVDKQQKLPLFMAKISQPLKVKEKRT